MKNGIDCTRNMKMHKETLVMLKMKSKQMVVGKQLTLEMLTQQPEGLSEGELFYINEECSCDKKNEDIPSKGCC